MAGHVAARQIEITFKLFMPPKHYTTCERWSEYGGLEAPSTLSSVSTNYYLHDTEKQTENTYNTNNWKLYKHHLPNDIHKHAENRQTRSKHPQQK